MTKQWVLIQLRSREKLTQKQFADKVGINYYSYMDKENGYRSFKDIEMFKISDYYNMPIEKIFLRKDCIVNAVGEDK